MHAVRTEFIRIGVVFAILLAIAGWQFGFVANAISANPVLNFVILGTFVFGLSLVALLMGTLRNEYRALYALFELHDDVTKAEARSAIDPLWRYYRCTKVGIVFDPPRILGQSYNLIREQLTRDAQLTISAGTMQTLVGGIDQRLSESKSLTGYVSGTLIFLGLIGTFIGLMVTLSSVGSILGDLDLTGSDPTATVAALMTNLQTPLSGMATGFSSSLFGLVTSLTLSVMMQMLNRAGRALQADFSDWLSNIVELSDSSDGVSAAPGHREAAIEERRLALLMKTARHAVQSQQRQSRAVEALTEKVSDLTIAQQMSERRLLEVADASGVLSDQHKILHRALARSIDMVKEISSAHNIKDEVAELTALMSVQLESRDSRLAASLDDVHRQLADMSRPQPDKASDDEADALVKELTEHTDELNVAQINKLLTAIYRKEDLEPDNEQVADEMPKSAGSQS